MTARTLTLSPENVERLRAGMTVPVADSDGRLVLVSTERRTGSTAPRLTIGEEGLKLAAEPEGLICADDERRTGWTVHVAEEEPTR